MVDKGIRHIEINLFLCFIMFFCCCFISTLKIKGNNTTLTQSGPDKGHVNVPVRKTCSLILIYSINVIVRLPQGYLNKSDEETFLFHWKNAYAITTTVTVIDIYGCNFS